MKIRDSCFMCIRHYIWVPRKLEQFRLHGMFGWTPDCEYPDLLHCLWLGSGRDACGSHLLDLAAQWQPLQDFQTWDERLRVIHSDLMSWCCRHNIRQSVIDEISYMPATRKQLFEAMVAMSFDVYVWLWLQWFVILRDMYWHPRLDKAFGRCSNS